MLKTKTKKTRGSTVDLVISHSRKHLIRRPHLLIRESMPSAFSKIASPLIFAFAGLVVIAAAIQIVVSANVETPAFVAQNATDYAAQRAFYTGASTENLHASADFIDIRNKIHEAAIATELSRILNVLGAILVFGGLFYLHEKHGIFSGNRAGFRIRRIQ
ncbi:MAG: hypothetical protein K9L85_03915 [Candidatus Peribacteraceae bacterium]|nr:hypothetical protein [Candidatus Peribacteraceae bacterium]